MADDDGPFGPPPPDLRKKCPECGQTMGFNVDTDGTQTTFPLPAPLPPPTTWECPQCGLQEDAGADVEAKLEGRPRLL